MLVRLVLEQDNDEYFEKQKAFMLEYHNRLHDATGRADRLSRAHKSESCLYSNSYDKLRYGVQVVNLVTIYNS